MMIAQYAAYLARSLKTTSIRQYMSVIRLIHIEAGLPNPMEGNWYIQSTLKGIDRLLGTPTVRRAPVSPDLLIAIRTHLNLNTVPDSMFWAACLLMFFGLLRKANLFPNSTNAFDGRKQFIRTDFTGTENGSVLVNVKHSKTNQFAKRNFDLSLLCTDHVLCPACAIHKAFQLCPLPRHSPAFVDSTLGNPMTGFFFNKRFKEAIATLAIDPARFSSHSFRRGGAAWALQCGVPGEVVQQLGDWRSERYKDYLDELPQRTHDYYRSLVMSLLPTY